MQKISYTNLLVKMILGGLIVATTSYIANSVSPLYAGLFWSFPINLIVLYFIFLYDNTSSSHISQFFATTALGLINLSAFCLAMSITLYNYENIYPAKLLLISTVIWAIMGYLSFGIITKIINYYY